MNDDILNNRYKIGKVYCTITNPEDSVRCVKEAVAEGRNDYVCVASIRTIFTGNSRKDYADVLNKAMMVMPDGMPLTWVARVWGLKQVQRSSGPELFLNLLTDPSNGIKHFLLGDTEDTLVAMKQRYSDSLIVGSYSPPFCRVEEFDYPAIAKMIKGSGANIVWVALQAPKQDFFSTMLLPYLEHTLCIGVGAAFRFSLGEYSMPPMFFQKLGLTGLFWRKLDKKVLNDYCRAIPCVFSVLWTAFNRRLRGKKYYE